MRKKSILLFVLISLCFVFGFSQKKIQKAQENSKPKLIIGLVIDQMRWDFLYRFKDLYGNEGFKRILSEGFSYENTMIPYTPTFTAPGHTCIYTGSVPSIHGIIGNDWFDKKTNRSVYCVDDSSVVSLGSKGPYGKMSPVNMLTTTVTDELRLSNNFKSRVFGIAIKDRSSILPAGHAANGAFWYDSEFGKWTSSSYYMNQLPSWVDQFNDKNIPDHFLDSTWNTILPIEKYTMSTADNKEYEGSIPGLSGVNFPYNLGMITKNKFESFKCTPFAATYTFDFAKTLINNERLGLGAVTDFLTVSISSTDETGHLFGPNSIEVADTYLRLDLDIAAFLKYLDGKFGKDHYLLFLTADHGVAHSVGFLNEHSIPAGLFKGKELGNELNAMIEKKYSVSNCIQSLMNFQVYMNKEKIRDQGKNEEAIMSDVIEFLKQQSFISDAVETNKINEATIAQPIKENMINGYNVQRSGDIQFTVKPGYFDRGTKGTTHGSWNPYDAHIPLLFFGKNIQHGKTNREVHMTDIAPTIAAMLQIQMPSGCVGKVLEEVTEGY